MDAYEDASTGTLARNEMGKEVMTAVVLRPLVTFHDRAPNEMEYAALRQRAHGECYLANSVRTAIAGEPTLALTTG